MTFSNVNKWYGKWNALFDKWEVSPYEVNVACKENEGQLSYHASYSKGKQIKMVDTKKLGEFFFSFIVERKNDLTDWFSKNAAF